MYGTLEEKTKRSAEDQEAECRVSANSKWAGGSSAVRQQQERRRRRIYSHCHVQQQAGGHKHSPDGEHGNGDEPDHLSQGDKSARKRLIAASIICLSFMIAEIVGGIMSNSLAIATDAAHLLTDFSSFMISLFALWLAARPATKRMSFGWYRAEVIGALLSVLMIWLVTGLLVYLAIERLRTQEFEIDTTVMVITASAGLLVNIIMAVALNVDGHSHGFFGHSHAGSAHHHHHRNHNHQVHLDVSENDERENVLISKQQLRPSADGSAKSSPATTSDAGTSILMDGSHNESARQHRARHNPGSGASNINVRAAFIHVIGDFLQSLGVLIAALVIHFEPRYAIVDPICTFLFSFIVLLTTLNIMRDAVNILMEGMPDGINFLKVQNTLHSLPHVVRVHNLRIWSLSLDKIALSTHLVIDGKKTSSSQTLKLALRQLKDIHDFYEVTIQIEEFREEMKDCKECREEDNENGNALVVDINSPSADRLS